MDYMRIIRRSFEITWLYRALWIFGLILALTTAKGGGGNGGGGGGGGGSSFLAHPGLIGQNGLQVFDPQGAAAVLMIVAGIIVALLLAVIFVVARVVAETALIRMVNDHEDSGVRLSIGQGFRLGWSRSALRIFLIDLLLVFGILLAFVVIFAIAAAPLATWLSNSDTLRTIGTAIAVPLLVLVFALFIAVVITAAVLLPFFHRACVLEGQGVIDSLRRGWAVFRSRASDAIIMTLALFCIGLAITLALIPVVILLGLGGTALAALPGVLSGLVASLFLHGQLPILVGLVVGLPILLLIIIVPILFISSLAQVFTSTAWTLTYREILSLTTPRAETPAAI